MATIPSYDMEDMTVTWGPDSAPITITGGATWSTGSIPNDDKINTLTEKLEDLISMMKDHLQRKESLAEVLKMHIDEVHFDCEDEGVIVYTGEEVEALLQSLLDLVQ